MQKQQSTVTLRCDCNCTTLVIDKCAYDGEINYSISMQDSRYDHNFNSVFGRLKRAFKIIFGKPIYYNDVFIQDEQKFKIFLKRLNKLAANGDK